LGTTFSFALNERAQVTFAFTQRASGRRVTRVAISFRGHADTNKVFFDGAISRSRELAAGRYTLIIAATATGLGSKRGQLSFTIVR